MTRLDRMKHGSGIKDRDDRSNGIEIRISEALAKINPTDPLILAKQAASRNLNCSDSSGNSLSRAEESFFRLFFSSSLGLVLESKSWWDTRADVQ